MTLEEFWQEKSDREVELATRQILEYTEEAQQIIRIQAKKRGISESPAFTRSVVRRDPNLLGNLLEKSRLDGLDTTVSHGFLRKLVGAAANVAWLAFFSFCVALLLASGQFILAFAITVGILYAAYTAIVYRNCYLLIYEQGVVYEQPNQKRVAYYDELEIWQEITQLYLDRFRLIPIGKESERYTLRFPDGETVETFQGSIGKKLQMMVVQHQLPQVLEAYNQGCTVQMGAIYLDQKGIIVQGKSVYWSDVSRVDTIKGIMYVHRSGDRFATVQIPVSDIPNLYVLLNLLEQLGYCKFKETTV